MNISALTSAVMIFLACAACDTQAHERDGRSAGSGTNVPGEPSMVAGKSPADWMKLDRDEFTREIDSYFEGLDRRIAAAKEPARTAVQEERADAKEARDQIRTATETAWPTTRAALLDLARSIEARLE